MIELSEDELVKLIGTVFPLDERDRTLAILVDVPRTAAADNQGWRERRAMTLSWYGSLSRRSASIPMANVFLYGYPAVEVNNAELPAYAYRIDRGLPEAGGLFETAGERIPFATIFSTTDVFLAPTEYSATAPLKNAARRFGFRAATMPGFNASMIPALRLDYGEVARRVSLLKTKLDQAESAEIRFLTDSEREDELFIDLRRRTAHESSGRFPERGSAGNLPSGEAYIVPYEGEEDESQTSGVMPCQIGDKVVSYLIERNTAAAVEGEDPLRSMEEKRLQLEPAYGNLAELGFGVLSDFGIEPCGEILLDEKLGLHIAFGRSDHFGGRTGPADFSSPGAAVHIDRIYIKATQPRVEIVSVVLNFSSGPEAIMLGSRYMIF